MSEIQITSTANIFDYYFDDNSTFNINNFTTNLILNNSTSLLNAININNEIIITNKVSWLSSGRIQIQLYTIILLLAIVGNLLVISTLIRNYRMRTITNLFLLNLAFSDILLGVLCMPFTLVGTLLRDFVFGEVLCKLIPFLQATSVAVSSWTLVAISCERYYAICHPLRSRSWQTIRHAYKIIAFIWLGSFVCMSPIAGFSQLIPTNQGSRKKCREQWPLNTTYNTERAYNIFLDVILLVIPLVILCAAYFLITRTLWMGIRAERTAKNNSANSFSISLTVSLHQQHCSIEEEENSQTKNYDNQIINHHGYSARKSRRTFPTNRETQFLRTSSMKYLERNLRNDMENNRSGHKSKSTPASPPVLRKQFDSILRRSNVAQNLENKQRVIRMLFVLVLEFFLCWTPLYVINTIVLFDPMLIYQNLGYTAITYFQLLAYSSSCCNPITYCFMNASFRRAFLDTFKGLKISERCRSHRNCNKRTNTIITTPTTTTAVPAAASSSATKNSTINIAHQAIINNDDHSEIVIDKSID